jgi:hypothetical protein
LLGAIESTIPATPVPVFCLAFAGVAGETGVTRGQLTSEVRGLIARLRTAQAPIAFGDAFPIAAAAETDIPGLDDQLAAQSEAEMVVTLAGYALERRDLIRFTEGRFELVDDGARVMSYYANSIVHYLESPPTS